jgi:hypothetical protein
VAKRPTSLSVTIHVAGGGRMPAIILIPGDHLTIGWKNSAASISIGDRIHAAGIGNNINIEISGG